MKDLKRIFLVTIALFTSAPAFAAGGMGDNLDSDGPIGSGAEFGSFYSVFNDHTDRQQIGIMDPSGKSITLVVDRATDRVYLADSLGRTTDLSIASFGAAFSPGAAGSSYANELRSSLSNDVGYIMSAFNYSSPYILQLPPLPGGPCDLEPCPPRMPNSGFLGGEYSYRSQFAEFPQTWRQFYSAETIAADRLQFDRWQLDKCEQSTSHYQDAALSGLGTVAACAAVETGIGAAACISAASITLNSIRRGDNAGRQCTRQYPGPGSW